jgi:hypothetical protein
LSTQFTNTQHYDQASSLSNNEKLSPLLRSDFSESNIDGDNGRQTSPISNSSAIVPLPLLQQEQQIRNIKREKITDSGVAALSSSNLTSYLAVSDNFFYL